MKRYFKFFCNPAKTYRSNSGNHFNLTKLLLYTILFLLPNIIFGQISTITVKGFVFDNQNNHPLENVNILAVKTQHGTITDKNGFFEITLNYVPDTIKLSHINYNPAYLIIKTPKDTNTSVKLSKTIYTLEEISIKSEKDVYNKKSDFTILDYNFIYKNLMVLLKKKTSVNIKTSLVILDEKFDTIVTSVNMPKNTKSIFKDCLNYYHILTNDSSYQLVLYNDSLSLMPPVDINHFYWTLGDCLFRINHNIYFKNISLYGYATQIYYINENTKKKKRFIKSIDTNKYSQFSTDIHDISSRYWGYNIPTAAVENDSLLLENIRKYEHNYRFLKEIGDKPVQSYIFHNNDTIFFFDLTNQSIQFYSNSDSLINNIKIDWGESILRKSEIIEDVIQHKYYVIYRNSGLFNIYLINYQNGTLKPITNFSQMTHENIKINNNYIYFLYNNNSGYYKVKQLRKICIKHDKY